MPVELLLGSLQVEEQTHQASMKLGITLSSAFLKGVRSIPFNKGTGKGLGIIPDHVVPAQTALAQAISLAHTR
jgi:hypothetical protein